MIGEGEGRGGEEERRRRGEGKEVHKEVENPDMIRNALTV